MMTTAQRDAIVSPPHGLHIFNTDEGCLNYYNSTYQFWSCYCDECKATIIHIAENDCSIDFNNEYAPEDPDAKYILVIDTGVIISTCQVNELSAIHFLGVLSPRLIKIFNYGTIEGLGGNGGDGNIISLGGNCNINYASENGTEGGLAIKTISGVTIQIINHGTNAGGGGGGGGDGDPSGFGGGGGGGAGINFCIGGNGGGERSWNGSSCQLNQLASPRSNGTVIMGGAGGAGASGGGTGGNGGGRAQAGQSGIGQSPGSGGAAGKAISGGSGNTITNMGSGQSFGVVD